MVPSLEQAYPRPATEGGQVVLVSNVFNFSKLRTQQRFESSLKSPEISYIMHHWRFCRLTAACTCDPKAPEGPQLGHWGKWWG